MPEYGADRKELKRRDSIGKVIDWRIEMGLDGPSRRIIVQPQEQPAEQPQREAEPSPVETPEREPEKVPA